ncbi:hypothetical protein GCM10010282_72760 [Streptomyces roseolus]|nr:hypothetical protein GCM10010282_72760 [Streptomyces roseolus]
MAESTFSRVAESTFCRLFATRETVCEETPAIVATSAMDGHWRAGRDRGDRVLLSVAMRTTFRREDTGDLLHGGTFNMLT